MGFFYHLVFFCGENLGLYLLEIIIENYSNVMFIPIYNTRLCIPLPIYSFSFELGKSPF